MSQTHPKWRYSTGQSVLVNTPEEEAALVGDWFDFPHELAEYEAALKAEEDAKKTKNSGLSDDALSKRINDLTDDGSTPDIETLRKTAKDLGIEFHHRAGAGTLEQLIKEHIERKGE